MILEEKCLSPRNTYLGAEIVENNESGLYTLLLNILGEYPERKRRLSDNISGAIITVYNVNNPTVQIQFQIFDNYNIYYGEIRDKYSYYPINVFDMTNRFFCVHFLMHIINSLKPSEQKIIKDQIMNMNGYDIEYN